MNDIFGPKRRLGTYSPNDALKKLRKALLNAFLTAQLRKETPAVFFKKARNGALPQDMDWLEQRFKKAIVDFMNVNKN